MNNSCNNPFQPFILKNRIQGVVIGGVIEKNMQGPFLIGVLQDGRYIHFDVNDVEPGRIEFVGEQVDVGSHINSLFKMISNNVSANNDTISVEYYIEHYMD